MSSTKSKSAESKSLSDVTLEIGNLSTKFIPVPCKPTFKDITKEYGHIQKLVCSAGGEIMVVNTDNTYSTFTSGGGPFGGYRSKAISIVPDEKLQGHSTTTWPKVNRKPRLPEAINRCVMRNSSKYFIENDGAIHSIEDRNYHFTLLGKDQLYGGFITGTTYEEHILILVQRKDGSIVKWFKRGQPQVIATGLIDPVKIIVYKENAYFLVLGCSSNTVYFFNANWEMKHLFGEYGEGDGQLNHPYDIAVTPYGTILVADTNNYRVTEYSINGEFLRTVVSFRKERGKIVE